MPKGFGKYKTLSEISEEEKGKAPKWLGSGDPHEAERWLLERDVPKAEGEALEHDGLAYLGAAGGLKALGPAMGTAGLGKAAGDIKEDPLNPKSYLKAINSVKDFGGFDMNPIASEAMIPTSKNIGKFRERMLEKLGKEPKDATTGDMIKSYLEVRRPVLTSKTGGTARFENITPEKANELGWHEGIRGQNRYTQGDEGYSAFFRENHDPVSLSNTASHELMHSAQKKRRPEIFDNYPINQKGNFDIYYNHPAEVQARRAGDVGEDDFINFTNKHVPEDWTNYDKPDWNSVDTSTPENLTTKDLKNWLQRGYESRQSPPKSKAASASGGGDFIPDVSSEANALDPLNETRYWIHPDGEMQKLGFDEYHDQVSMKQFGHRGQEESLQKGFSRVSNNIGQVGVGASEDSLNRTVRLATKSALNDRMPLVFLEIYLPKGMVKEITFQAKSLLENNYDISKTEPLSVIKSKAPQGGGF